MSARSRLLLAALVLIRLAGDAVRLLQDPDRFVDGEERYSATVGWYLHAAGLWDQVLALQYKTFCGGCTVHALTASALGDSWLAWKALAGVWTAAILLVGFWAMDRREGRTAAWCFAVLFAFPPPGMSALSLMLWGNHGESGLFVVAALAGGPLQGLALGLGLWFARITAYALPILAEPIAARRPWPLVGLAAAGLALLPAARGDAGDYDLSFAANVLPDGIGGVPSRLAWLLHPAGLAVRMETPTWVAGAWLSGVAVAVVLLLRGRRWAIPGLIFTFLVFWGASGFDIPRGWTGAPLLQDRYHAPWFLLGTLTLAAASARQRVLLIPGILPFFFGFSGTPLSLADRPLVDHGGFATVAFRRLTPDRLARAHSADPVTERALRRLEGYAAAERERLTGEAAPGLTGEALAALWQARTPPGSDVAGLPDDPDAQRGACWNLRFGLTGDGAGVPCAEGIARARACDDAQCLADALRDQPDDVVWGAALACRRGCDGVRNALPAERREAWDSGRAEDTSPLVLERAPAGLRGSPGGTLPPRRSPP